MCTKTDKHTSKYVSSNDQMNNTHLFMFNGIFIFGSAMMNIFAQINNSHNKLNKIRKIIKILKNKKKLQKTLQ